MSRQPTPSSSSRASPAPTPIATDLYRPLAAQIQRPLAPLLDGQAGSSSSTSLSALLGTDAATYNSRLSGKTVLLTDLPSSSSELVTGRKRNRGDPKALAATKAEQAAVAAKPTRTARRAKAVLTPATRIDYNSILPLHYLHTRYMAQLIPLAPAPSDLAVPTPPPGRGPALLPNVSPEALQSKLVKADFTGAQLSVVAAKNSSLAGIRGIVVEETAGSFRLVGEDGRVRVIPKAGAQFSLSFPAYARTEEWEWDEFVARCPRVEVEILGSAFAFRSGDRAGRKFRPAQGGGGGCGWAEEWVQSSWGELLGRVGEADPDARAKRRKRNKHRRKDPLAHGSVQVF